MNNKLIVALFSLLVLSLGKARSENLTPENQVIGLRHIIEQTSDPQQREAALKLMVNAGTYQALTFAASLMGDEQPQTAKAAASTVWQILAAHPEYNGKESREMLSQAIPLLEKKQKKQAKTWLDGADQNEEGFVCLFNGKNLDGWKGLVENPIARAKMNSDELAKAQEKADGLMRRDWIIENGELVYIGNGSGCDHGKQNCKCFPRKGQSV